MEQKTYNLEGDKVHKPGDGLPITCSYRIFSKC